MSISRVREHLRTTHTHTQKGAYTCADTMKRKDVNDAGRGGRLGVEEKKAKEMKGGEGKTHARLVSKREKGRETREIEMKIRFDRDENPERQR